jgi:hypothetical protein
MSREGAKKGYREPERMESEEEDNFLDSDDDESLHTFSRKREFQKLMPTGETNQNARNQLFILSL